MYNKMTINMINKKSLFGNQAEKGLVKQCVYVFT